MQRSRRWYGPPVALASLVLTVLAAELAMRLAMPWLLPERKAYSDAEGLPMWLEYATRRISASKPDLLIIGDSFVATGYDTDQGWIARLRRNTSRRIEAIGIAGGSPSQYWLVLDRLRMAGVRAHALVVFYIGNDLADEAVWLRSAEDRSSYLDNRRAFYSDSSQPTFVPCFEPQSGGVIGQIEDSLRQRSALYRAALIFRARLKGLADWESATAEQALIGCDRAPWAERIGGRLFFLHHHDAVVNPAGDNAEAAAAIRSQLLERRSDPSLTIVVILDREENCAAVHGRPIALAAPMVDEIRALGLRVLDPNPLFQVFCGERNLYLPDGHWTVAGHALFEAAMEQLLRQARTLDPAAPPDRRPGLHSSTAPSSARSPTPNPWW